MIYNYTCIIRFIISENCFDNSVTHYKLSFIYTLKTLIKIMRKSRLEPITLNPNDKNYYRLIKYHLVCFFYLKIYT